MGLGRGEVEVFRGLELTDWLLVGVGEMAKKSRPLFSV